MSWFTNPIAIAALAQIVKAPPEYTPPKLACGEIARGRYDGRDPNVKALSLIRQAWQLTVINCPKSGATQEQLDAVLALPTVEAVIAAELARANRRVAA